MIAQLPALQVVVPLICAGVCIMPRSAVAGWLVYAFAALATLASAVLLTAQVYSDGAVHYAMGGWPGPVGIDLVIDRANVPVLLLLGTIAVIVAGYARRSIEAEINHRRIPMFYASMCLMLTGLLGIAVTGDAFNLFVFLEISSLSSYALIAMGRRRRALLAAFQYLIIGTVGGTFVLLGVGLTYAVTGTLNMADLGSRLPDVYGNEALTAAVLFVFIGLAIKIAIFPLHAWLPGAYGEAPSAISVMLAATGTKVALYAFARFAFSVYGAGFVFETLPVREIGLIVASATMLIAAAVACFQHDMRRLLAWSSISQVGMILAGVMLATAGGVSAAYLHLMNHAIIKAALFCVAGIAMLRLGSTSLPALAGLGRRMPLTFAAIIVAGLGLIGVPPTAGFVSKWALAVAMEDEGQWVVLAVLLISSLLALVYVGRLIEVGWFREPPGESWPPEEQPQPVAKEAATAQEPAATETLVATRQPNPARNTTSDRTPPSMAVATALLVLATLYFGIDASLLSSLADGAAAVLTGGGR
ncbi:MAG: monovalent cation/H+ antiporter subunit D family protein [bacterium]